MRQVCVGAAVVKKLFMGELVMVVISEVHFVFRALDKILKIPNSADAHSGCVYAPKQPVLLV